MVITLTRITVAKVAAWSGKSEGAVRQAIARGTLPSEKDDLGVWVPLDAAEQYVADALEAKAIAAWHPIAAQARDFGLSFGPAELEAIRARVSADNGAA